MPILYTINVAFTNYSTGHILTKSEAIEAIQLNSLDQLAERRQFDMAAARDATATSSCCSHDQGEGGQVYVGTEEGPRAARRRRAYTLGATGQPASAKGYTLVKGAELFALDQQLASFRVPDDRHERDPAAGHLERGRARADAPLRRRRPTRSCA